MNYAVVQVVVFHPASIFLNPVGIQDPLPRLIASSASVIQFVIADHDDFLPQKVLFGSFPSFLPVSKKKKLNVCLCLMDSMDSVSMAGLRSSSEKKSREWRIIYDWFQ